MTAPKALFIIGNKRSGTSLLTRILNQHPQVYVSYESDVAWLLYLASQGKEPESHEWDSDIGMNNTLEYTADDIERLRITNGWDVEREFFRLQEKVRQGTKWAKVKDGDSLAIVGDKKPVQYADPQVADFILKNFDAPHIIHIIRHPQAAVGSMHRKRTMQGAPAFWGWSPDKILERWCVNEHWVLRLKHRYPVYTVRFEDLCNKAQLEADMLFSHLGMDAPQNVGKADHPNMAYRSNPIELTDEAREIMRQYGYGEQLT